MLRICFAYLVSAIYDNKIGFVTKKNTKQVNMTPPWRLTASPDKYVWCTKMGKSLSHVHRYLNIVVHHFFYRHVFSYGHDVNEPVYAII